MYKIKKSLLIKLSALIMLGTGLVLLAVILLTNQTVSTQLLDSQENFYNALAEAAAGKINQRFQNACSNVDSAAERFKLIPVNRKNAINLMHEIIKNDKNIFGTAIALAPSVNTKDTGYQILYSWMQHGKITSTDRLKTTIDYQSDWFYLPYYLKTPLWSDLYYDDETKTIMTTYSVPIIENDQVTAVITCDLTVSQIKENLEGLNLGQFGEAILISEEGRFIIHPNDKWVMRETIFSLAEGTENTDDRDTLLTISKNLKKNPSGSFRYKRPYHDDHAWLYYQHIPATGWTLAFMIPQSQILAPISTLNRHMILVAIIGVILLLIPAFLVSLSVTNPLKSICAASAKLASGDFSASLPVNSRNDEIGQLIHHFDDMRIKLNEYVVNLTSTTAAKERIESELNIAKDIQEGMLPTIFPPYPDRTEIDLYASMTAAKEVGGDFYDFFFVDKTHFCIVIGDVSGKGVPASLFMAISKCLLQSHLRDDSDNHRNFVADFKKFNETICQNNPHLLFVTIFACIINLDSGEAEYINAGHNPPIMITNGIPSLLSMENYNIRPPIGTFDDTDYEKGLCKFSVGDKIILYTDGVTEAHNCNKELYGEERMLKAVEAKGDINCCDILNCLHEDIASFVKEEPASDDITMLAFEYRGTSKS